MLLSDDATLARTVYVPMAMTAVEDHSWLRVVLTRVGQKTDRCRFSGDVASNRRTMNHTVLVACLGNICRGDDGFGVEVIKRLAAFSLPDWVRLADFGIRGMHLFYDILDQDYDTIILVDITARGGAPGTLYLIEADGAVDTETDLGMLDARAMTPDMIVTFLQDCGGVAGRVLILGCEPARLEEAIGLSDPVMQAVGQATTLLLDILWQEGRVGVTGASALM